MTPRSAGSAIGTARVIGELLAAPNSVSDECIKLLATVRAQCPGLLPAAPLPAGTVGPTVTLSPEQFQQLAGVAAVRAAQLPAGAPTDTVVFTQAGSELLVIVAKVVVRVTDGIVLVTIPVQCDQVGSARVQVAFAVGSVDQPAGMVAVAEERPRGPRAIVDLWGDALTAYAWQVVLSVTSSVAAATGEDVDGAPLIPAAFAASADGVQVLTMARHTFDRVTP